MNYFKNIILIFLSAILFGACDDYLDVSPKDEVPREELFNTESGFAEALSGVYVTLKSGSLYGGAMTLTTVEHLVSNWPSEVNSPQEKLNYFQYDDKDVDGQFRNIYSTSYYAIAQINAILEFIDKKNDEGVFVTPGKYELIKGECLAIRAYCHFDLLRLFGPVPTEAGSDAILTYMTQLTKEVVPAISFDKFKIELFKDISAAIELLGNDPIINYSVLALRSGGTARDVKFNYYAAVALKARMHLWFNEKPEAYAAAIEVIDATDDEEFKKFPLGTVTDMDAGDLQLTGENVIGLYVHNLPTISTELFNIQGGLYHINKSYIHSYLYQNSEGDIRTDRLWKEMNEGQETGYVFQKYMNESNDGGKDLKTIPLMRISEMYFIAVECADDHVIANELWNAFLKGRNMTNYDLPEDPFIKEMLVVNEYRKELFGEGQAFFAYKRLNFESENMLWVPGAAEVNYVVPIPKRS